MAKRTPSDAQISDVMAELGKRGGKARAAKMTPAQRRASARNAIEARWGKNGTAAALETETELARFISQSKKKDRP